MTSGSVYALSTACLAPLRLPTVAQVAADAGYHGLELVVGWEQLLHRQGWTQRVAASLPLPVLSVHQPLFGLGRWRDPARLVGETMELAVDLGANVVVLHSPRVTSWDQPLAQAWLAALECALEQGRDTGTCLTVENQNDGGCSGSVLGSLRQLAMFCRQRGLGLTYDTCHAGAHGADLRAELLTVSDVLANVHLSDYAPDSALARVPILDLMTTNHQMVGEGVLDLEAALQTLSRVGYRGAITFELSPFVLRAWAPTTRAARLRQALAYARQAVEGANQSVAEVSSALMPAE